MKKKGKTRASRLTLDVGIFARRRNEQEKTQSHRILSEVLGFDAAGRFDLVRNVAGHALLPRELIPLYPMGERFQSARSLPAMATDRAAFQWFLGLAWRNLKELREFVRLRKEINAAVLLGDADGALSLLSDLASISESWWGIETSIHIRKEVKGIDVRSEISGLSTRFPWLNTAYLSQGYMLLSEGSSPDIYINTVLSRLTEYRRSDVKSARDQACIESAMMLPAAFDSARTPRLASFRAFSRFSLFDQYVLLQSVVHSEMNVAQLTESDRLEILQLDNAVGGDIRNTLTYDLDGNYDESSCCDFVRDTVLDYTHGKYSEVTERIEAGIANGDSRIWGLMELYARSVLYRGASFGATFYDRIASNIGLILSLDQRSQDACESLIGIAVKFRAELWAKSLIYHVLHIYELVKSEAEVSAARRELVALGDANTERVVNPKFDIRFMRGVNLSDVPSHRLARYASTFDYLESDFPVRVDYLSVRANSLLSQADFPGVIDFCIEQYFSNARSFSFLPFRDVCLIIRKAGSSGEFGFRDSLIFLNIFGKEGGAEFEDFKSTLFQDFMATQEDFRPSKLFEGRELTQRDAVFLRHICVPGLLDGLVEFPSYDDIMHERVAILDLLMRSRQVDVDDVAAEMDKVLETLFSEKLRAKIESGKLYVDIQALYGHRSHVYESLFAQAKAFGADLSLDRVDSRDVEDSTDIVRLPVSIKEKSGFSINEPVQVVASSEKSGLLLKIFMQAATDFALNENYGLDKYLSAEVRHVVFVSQLRACFERRGLVTMQSGGEYLSNDYWVQKYHYVSSQIVGALDERLADFSRRIDEALYKVNDRFRVDVTSERTTTNAFDFRPFTGRIVEVLAIVNSSSRFDEFFEGLMGLMWEIAERGSRAAQAIINDELLREVEQSLDDLEADIRRVRGDAAVFELMQEIRSVRSDFRNEIEVVLSWFRASGAKDESGLERLTTVVEAAVSAFESAFEHKGRILERNFERGDLLLTYVEAKSLFISLFTALENGLRYGCPGEAVKISVSVGDARTVVAVCNSMIRPSLVGDSELIDSIKQKWSDKYSELSRSEGGTGLYKIYNMLRVSSGFDVNVSIVRDEFIVEMGLAHENFGDRG